MGNILDHLAWRGDLALEQVPFGEVDALILSVLAYVHLEGLVPAGMEAVELGRTAERYLALPEDRRGRRRCDSDLELLQALAQAPRFAGMELTCYASRFVPKEETQFAAVTVLPGDGSAFLAFRGTDATLVGWKEDFNMCFMDVVPAQLLAARYAERLAKGFPGTLDLGGHSKGGNLAVAGAALCPMKVRDRIGAVWSFDGPGFTEHLLGQPGYQELLTRIHGFVPQSSVVGMLLSRKEPHTVIRSDQEGLFQHDPYSWQVLRNSFIPVEEVTQGSRMVDRTLKDWLAGLDREQRETVVDTLFQLLSSGDAKTLREALDPRHLASVLLAVRDVEPKDLAALAESMAGLLRSALRAV